MTSPDVLLVPTGTANLASVEAAFARLGARTARVADPSELLRAPRVVVPGVGAFAAGRRGLEARGLTAPLRARVREGRATLGICLGLQLFAAASDESVGVDGLALFERAVERLPDDVRLPHMGFNDVIPDRGARLVERGAAYFAHSYALRDPPAGFSGARATHGVSFVAALERGALLFCQFHPELSGAYGRALLGRWLDATRAGGL